MVRRDGAVAVVTLDNPPLNSMSDEVLDGLDRAFAELGGDAEVRAVVLAAEGERMFAAGADLRELQQLMTEPSAIAAHVGLTGRVLGRISGLRQPVVAAVQALALGGGLELALACDFVVLDERAEVGLPEVGLGLIPGAGGTQRLGRRIGSGRALRAILLGERISAQQALELGLATELAAPGDALAVALALAERLAAQPAAAVQSAKSAVTGAAEQPLPAGLERERELFVAILGSADAREGVAAFLERRPAAFSHETTTEEPQR